MKLLLTLSLLFTFGCTNHTVMGKNNRFVVDSIAEAGAPSVTVVYDSATHLTYLVGGQSLLSQLSGPASAAMLYGGLNRKSSMNINNSNSSKSNLNQEQSQSSANLNVQE